MTDIVSEKQRSLMMSKIRSKDTKPEWIIRSGLHRLGFRYRLKNRHLTGNPDLVLPKHGAIVFVHGCYWHRHSGCKHARMPKSNVDFWSRKFEKNVERDRYVQKRLIEAGWRVMVVWECELLNQTNETIRKVTCWLIGGNKIHGNYQHDILFNGRKVLIKNAEEKIRERIASY